MISNLLNRECQIVRRGPSGVEDRYGNEIPTENTVSTVCELQAVAQRSGNEPNGYNELSRTKWTIFFPVGTYVDSADTVVVDGEEYELDGDPWPVRNPRTQAASHVEASLIRVSSSDGGAS